MDDEIKITKSIYIVYAELNQEVWARKIDFTDHNKKNKQKKTFSQVESCNSRLLCTCYTVHNRTSENNWATKKILKMLVCIIDAAMKTNCKLLSEISGY